MDTSNPLLAGVVIAAGIQGATQVLNRILADPTAKKANQINADRLAMEREKAIMDREKQQTEERAREKKEIQDERDYWKKDAQSEREKAQSLRENAHALEKEIDAWRNRCILHGSLCQIEIKPKIFLPQPDPPSGPAQP